MVDLQTKKQLTALEKQIKGLEVDDIKVTKAEVALDGFNDDYDCIDVVLTVSSTRHLKTPDYITLINEVRDLVKSEGWEEWADIQIKKSVVS